MNKIIADYIWLDGSNDIRCKTRVLNLDNYSIQNIPEWTMIGSNTKQSTEQNPILLLKPCKIFPNPFYNEVSFIVLCEVYTISNTGKHIAHATNVRSQFKEYLNINGAIIKPEYEITQEYYILTNININDPKKQGEQHYCGVIPGLVNFRRLADMHIQYCIRAKLSITAGYPEGGLNQWAFTIGPEKDLECADQLIVARFILYKLAENLDVMISFHPCPFGKELKGSACHVGFSTLQTRLPTGYNEIMRIIGKLEKSHDEYIMGCGDDTKKRLNGEYGSSVANNFCHGVNSINTSISIPMETFINKSGSFQDRRPSANMNPYIICQLLFLTSLQ